MTGELVQWWPASGFRPLLDQLNRGKVRAMKSTIISVVVGVAACVAGVTLTALVLHGDSEPVRQPSEQSKVVIFEDGSGTLPPGTTNPVLGDVSGRVFCLAGELCEED